LRILFFFFFFQWHAIWQKSVCGLNSSLRLWDFELPYWHTMWGFVEGEDADLWFSKWETKRISFELYLNFANSWISLALFNAIVLLFSLSSSVQLIAFNLIII
jgi:hypothetical protein